MVKKRKSGGGRKALPKDMKLSGRVQVICTGAEQDAFAKEATAQGFSSPSQWARKLMSDALSTELRDSLKKE
jgi:hypothetical protein